MRRRSMWSSALSFRRIPVAHPASHQQKFPRNRTKGCIYYHHPKYPQPGAYHPYLNRIHPQLVVDMPTEQQLYRLDGYHPENNSPIGKSIRDQRERTKLRTQYLEIWQLFRLWACKPRRRYIPITLSRRRCWVIGH